MHTRSLTLSSAPTLPQMSALGMHTAVAAYLQRRRCSIELENWLCNLLTHLFGFEPLRCMDVLSMPGDVVGALMDSARRSAHDMQGAVSVLGDFVRSSPDLAPRIASDHALMSALVRKLHYWQPKRVVDGTGAPWVMHLVFELLNAGRTAAAAAAGTPGLAVALVKLLLSVSAPQASCYRGGQGVMNPAVELLKGKAIMAMAALADCTAVRGALVDAVVSQDAIPCIADLTLVPSCNDLLEGAPAAAARTLAAHAFSDAGLNAVRKHFSVVHDLTTLMWRAGAEGNDPTGLACAARTLAAFALEEKFTSAILLQTAVEGKEGPAFVQAMVQLINCREASGSRVDAEGGEFARASVPLLLQVMVQQANPSEVQALCRAPGLLPRAA